MILFFGNKSKGNKLFHIVVTVNIAISQLKNSYLPLKGQRNTCVCLLVGGETVQRTCSTVGTWAAE